MEIQTDRFVSAQQAIAIFSIGKTSSPDLHIR